MSNDRRRVSRLRGIVVAFIAIAAVMAPASAAHADAPPLVSTKAPQIIDWETARAPLAGQRASASYGSWQVAPSQASLQWFFNDVAIAGATGRFYDIPDADGGAGSLSVEVTASRAGFADTTVRSDDYAILRNMSQGSSAFTSTVRKVGVPLSVDASGWLPADATLSYAWRGANGLIPGQTSTSYTPTDEDLSGVGVDISATADGYAPLTVTLLSGAIDPDHFLPAKPTISGSHTVFATLTADAHAADWKPRPGKLTYRWYRSGHPITNATKPIYISQKADIGHTLTVTATGHSDGYTAVSATSSKTKAIASGYVHLPRPRLTGTAEVGRRLTMHEDRISYAGSYSFWRNWYVDGVLDPDAFEEAYYPASLDDVGKRVTMSITVLTRHGEQESQRSLPSAPIRVGTLHPGTIRLDAYVNFPSVGHYLGPLPPDGDIALSYRWLVDSAVVSTQSSFAPTPGQWHHHLREEITADVPGFPAVVTKSRSVYIHTGYFSGSPEIAGDAMGGSTLTVDLSSVTPTPTTTKIRWMLGTSLEGTHHLIGTGAHFTVPTKYVGHHVFAVVTLTGPHVENDQWSTRPVLIAKH